MTVNALAFQEGISEATLSNWPNQAEMEGKPVPGANKTTGQWSTEVCIAVIAEIAALERAQFIRWIREAMSTGACLSPTCRKWD